MAAFLLALLGASGPAGAEPVPALKDGNGVVPAGKSEGAIRLLLIVDKLEPAQMKRDAPLDVSVTDIGYPAGAAKVAAWKVTSLKLEGASSRAYVLENTASELPANTTQTRFLKVTVAGKDTTLPYSLSNAAAEKFTWTLRPLSGQAIKPDQPIALSISTGSTGAHDVRVLQSALLEKSTHHAIATKGLILCESGDQACNRSTQIPYLAPNKAHELWLWGVSEVGLFEGSVSIAAAEKPEGDSATMTIYSSTRCHQALGVACIVLGLAVSWFGTVLVRNRLSRDQMLRPVSFALDGLAELKREFDQGAPKPANGAIAARLPRIAAALDNTLLEANGLPRKMPQVSGPSPTSAADFKAYLQPQLDWIAALQLLIIQGLKPVWAAPLALLGGARQLSQRDALDAIDKLADTSIAAAGVPAPAMALLVPALAQILHDFNQLQPTPAPPAVAGFRAAAAAAGAPAITVPSPRVLETRISALNGASWIFAATVTVLAGAYVLVLGGSNAAGFGTPLDYLQCLIWGIGLPIGSQLMSSTTGSVATSLNMPKI